MCKSWMKRSILVLCGTLLLLTAAQARETTADPLPEYEEEIFFDDISSVYTASKYEQPLSEAPSLVTLITADEISRFGYRTLAEILDSVRGFYTTDDRNYEYAGVRGFGRPGDYNTRILLMLNGQRLNDNVYDAAAVGYEFSVDVNTIERVEIVRGPGSSLYGTSAFFAVINIITKNGRQLKGLRADLALGSFGSAKPSISYGDRFQNDLELYLSASFLDSDGDDLYFSEFDDPSTNNGIALNTNYEQAGNYIATVRWRDLSFQGAFQSREKGIPTGSYETQFNDPRNRTIDSASYLKLEFEHTFDNSITLGSHLDYGSYEYEGDYVYDWADPGDPPDLVVNHDYGLATWWGAGVQLAAHAGKRNHVVGGVDYRGSIDQLQQTYDRDVYLDDSRSNNNWGVFIQDELKIHPRLAANLGARHDHYDTFGGTTNPRLALIYGFGDRASLKFLYGTAFRAPNAYELYYHDGFNSQKPALDLEPESIETYELGLEKAFGDELRATVSAYRNQIEALIDQVEDPVDDLLVFRNLGDVESRGLELEVEGRLLSRLNGRISLAVQNTEDKSSGERLSNSPEHLAKLNLMSPLGGDKAFVGLSMRYIGDRLTLDAERIPSHLVTNLTLGSKQLYTGLGVSATVYNVFDTEYGHVISGEFEQRIMMQDGRSFRLQLGYEF